MVESSENWRVNFHIGAPRLAVDIVADVAKTLLNPDDKHARVLSANEYRRHLRPLINAPCGSAHLLGSGAKNQTRFWKRLTKYKVLTASQHAMLCDPKLVFKNNIIMPGAEERVGRLCDFFGSQELDLHLTIADQAKYISLVPGTYMTGDDPELTHDSIPSWSEFISRVSNACFHNRLIVWDFSDPSKVALPFAMTMLDVEEADYSTIKEAVLEPVQRSEALSKVFAQSVPDQAVRTLLLQQFEEDLHQIEQLPNVHLVRASAVPKNLYLRA